MIARRRTRKRSLIRTNAMTVARAGALSTVDGVTAFPREPNTGRIASLSTYAAPAPQAEVITYLRHLSTLHAAGILTDEEFSAARGRLLGS